MMWKLEEQQKRSHSTYTKQSRSLCNLCVTSDTCTTQGQQILQTAFTCLVFWHQDPPELIQSSDLLYVSSSCDRKSSSEKDLQLIVNYQLNVRIVLWPKKYCLKYLAIISVLGWHPCDYCWTGELWPGINNSIWTLKAWRGFKEETWEWPETVKEVSGIPRSGIVYSKPASWIVCKVPIPSPSQQGQAKLEVKLEKIPLL